MGKNKSSQISMSSAARGQKVVRSFPRDDSSANLGSKKVQKDGDLKGSLSNLSHSLEGASAK